jgi:hypothetical protein
MRRQRRLRSVLHCDVRQASGLPRSRLSRPDTWPAPFARLHRLRFAEVVELALDLLAPLATGMLGQRELGGLLGRLAFAGGACRIGHWFTSLVQRVRWISGRSGYTPDRPFLIVRLYNRLYKRGQKTRKHGKNGVLCENRECIGHGSQQLQLAFCPCVLSRMDVYSATGMPRSARAIRIWTLDTPNSSASCLSGTTPNCLSSLLGKGGSGSISDLSYGKMPS